ncbi:MAG: FAD-dependent oxidoreductase [Blastocatellia bacterium]|nr:FAD-dependent oxidoreductase [Blastocatellia bacterium]
MQSFVGNPDAIVIGGGMAGLAAATFLAKQGKNVRLFEQSQAVGGRARTKEMNGFYMNQGPHALYRSGRGIEVLRELGIEPRGRVPSISGAYAIKDGVKHTFPAGLVSMLTTGLFGLSAKLEAGRLLASIQKIDTRSLMSATVREWVENQISHPAVRELFLAVFRVSTYTNAPELMSAGAALEQVKMALDKNVLYLDGGWQTLVDEAERAAERAGVIIEKGFKVESVERTGAGQERNLYAVRGVRLSDGRRLATSTVVIASSPTVAARLVEDGEHPLLAKWADESIPVKAACLDIALSRLPNPKATFALGMDRPLYLSVHSAAARLAPCEGALIQLAKYLPPDDDQPPESVERELENLLELLQPGWREALVYRRFLPDMVVMNAIATARHRGTKGRPGPQVEDVPGLFVVGDWVGEEGLLVDASLASARHASDIIARYKPAEAQAAVR